MLSPPLRVGHIFRNLSIRTKLALLVLWTSGVAITLASTAFVINDTHMARRAMVEQLDAMTDVLGSTSTAALLFDDAQSATDVLSSLRLQEMVETACIYTAGETVFARYDKHPQPLPLPPMTSAVRQEFTSSGYLELTQPILREGELIGVIFVRASLQTLNELFYRNLAIMACVMAVSLGTSLALSFRLQRAISLPIIRLANAAQKITADRDFTVRVVKEADDELGALYDRFNEMIGQVEAGRHALQEAHNELESRVRHRTEELCAANVQLGREIQERVSAEEQLESTHQQLLDAARRAGMAEVATGVLHNVGNVLNSINVSATLVVERLQSSRVDQLTKVAALVQEHAEKLGEFVVKDPRGQQLPRFLGLLAPAIVDEHAMISRELDTLQKSVDHVKTIVATQQAYASVTGLIEPVDIAATLDDALRLNSASFDRHEILVQRRFEQLPKVLLDRQKLLQILVNLVKNGKDALLAGRPPQRTLVLGVRVVEDRLLIDVSDNGIGIVAENLTRIFTHGFTTKPTGHGFGLHSCANAAAEMGGSLHGTSAGTNHGALFTVEIPYQPTGH